MHTVGLLIVVLGRQQLLTKNTLTVVLPVLSRKTWTAPKLMLRLWGEVPVADVIGTFPYAAVAAHTDTFSHKVRQASKEIGQHAAKPGFWVTLLRSVLTVWLSALVLQHLPGAGAASPIIIVAIAYVVRLALRRSAHSPDSFR